MILPPVIQQGSPRHPPLTAGPVSALASPNNIPAQSTQSDDIAIISNGTLAPSGHPNSLFPISLTPDGLLIANTLSGKTPVGRLSTNGSYQLVNGQTGNMFQDEILKLSYKQGEHPFLRALQATERQRAIAGSEIPLLRYWMKQLGLSGAGVKVAIIDPYEDDANKEKKTKEPESPKDSSPSNLPPLPPPQALLAPGAFAPHIQKDWRISQHSEAVKSVINHPTWGTAPGSQVVYLPSQPTEPREIKNDNILELTQLLRNDVCGILDRNSAQLQWMMQLNDPSLRIASITWGCTRALLYSTVLSIINEQNENNNTKYPQIRYAILGNSRFGTVQDRFRAVTRYVDQFIIGSAPVQQAYQRYVETTRKAANRGIIPVVSMANDRNMFKDAPPLPSGSTMNLLACSPYVIAVAASNTNLTPGYREDDTISPFSSPGDGLRFNPTIAAPGQEIGTDTFYGPIARNMVLQGTSFSTPFTCGVIALMLEANPSLSFDQIKSILQQTATPIKASVADAGAGVLNPERAVAQALALRQAST
ncbi:MAG TPA: S8 family serine peptidase [Oculatellaceae cyanobacterium]